MIISLAQQKGGAGKTTLSVHIAAALHQGGARVLLVDGDVQGSALDWAAARPESADPTFPVVGIPRSNIHRELPAMAQDYDDILIDTPPRVSEIAKSAMAASDLVIMPCQPSPYDSWALEETIKLTMESMVFNQSMKAVIVINRKIPRTTIGRDISDILAGYDLPVLNAQVCQRVSFAETAAAGSTVIESLPDSTAAREINDLVREIKGMMSDGKEEN